jgi:hypothetical protein
MYFVAAPDNGPAAEHQVGIMSGDKTTTKSSFWYGHVADDHRGHRGIGNTPGKANEALKIAQKEDLDHVEHKSVTGFFTRGDKNK